MPVFRFLFRVVSVLLLAGMVSAAWLFREDILDRVRGWRGGNETGVGRPSPSALAEARDRVDSLNGWRADSIILPADGLASLLADGLPREVLSQFDSVSIALGDDRVQLNGRLDTSHIPNGVLGPLAGALDRYEPVGLGGTVKVVEPGTADWTIDRITLRGFDLPEPVSKEIVAQALSGSREGRIRILLPEGVGGLRIRPNGVILYPAAKR